MLLSVIVLDSGYVQYRCFSVLTFYSCFLVVWSFPDCFLLFLVHYISFCSYFPFLMITLITCILLSACHPPCVVNVVCPMFLPCFLIAYCEPSVHFPLYTFSVYFSVFFFSIAGTTVGFWFIICVSLLWQFLIIWIWPHWSLTCRHCWPHKKNDI